MLRRLGGNLLENARRRAGVGIEAALSVSPAGVRLDVSDGGPGVAEADRERIFAPSHRPAGHREGAGGVGLGLSLVRRIAAQHGGTARHLPRDGGGTTFRVELPAG